MLIMDCSGLIILVLGDSLSELYQGAYGELASRAWKRGVEMHVVLMDVLINVNENKGIVDRYVKKVRVVEPYDAPKLEGLFWRRVKAVFRACLSLVKRFLVIVVVFHLLLLILLLFL